MQPTRGVPATRVPNVSQTPWQWLVGPWDWQRGVPGGSCWSAPAPSSQLQLQGTGPAGAGEEVDVIGLTWDPPTHVPSPTVDMREMTVISCRAPRSTSSLLLSRRLWLLSCCLQPWERVWDGPVGSGRSLSCGVAVSVLLLFFLSMFLSRQPLFSLTRLSHMCLMAPGLEVGQAAHQVWILGVLGVTSFAIGILSPP